MALVSRADRERPDRAVTTVEYSLVLAGVAALVVAAFVTFPDAIRQLYDQVFCQLGGSCQPHAGGGGPSMDPWDSPDPLVRAKWGNMVVMGDSYSSGEGGDDYGVTGSTPSCHASANAYGPAVAKSLGMSGRLTVSACTGATLSDIDGRYRDHNQPPQIGTVDANTSLITITMGGNDIGWGKLVADCVEKRAKNTLVRQIGFGQTCQDLEAKIVNQRIKAVQPKLESAYADLREQAPHARLVVMGYPRFFPVEPSTNASRFHVSLIDTSDQAWMNSEIEKLNATIQKAAEAQGEEYVDVTAALAGHEVTTDDPWMWGLDSREGALLKGAKHDFHPTQAGQAAMAKLAERQISHP